MKKSVALIALAVMLSVGIGILMFAAAPELAPTEA